MAGVNWTVYTEDQLHELELAHLAAWVTGESATGTMPEPARVPAPAASVTRRTLLRPSPDQNEVASHPPPNPRADVAPPAAMQRATPAQPVPVPASPTPATIPRSPAEGLGPADWSTLRERVAKCAACGLCAQRKQAVFGTGVPTGPWMFVGEGPGADEDEVGEPFVGQAGKLLDAMLSAIQLSRRDNVYIANVVKCRPPGNRTPTLEEAAACADWLDRQIDLVNPKVIVALGKTAAVRLTGQNGSLASLRGQPYNYRGFPVLVTYHPAYLLRNLPDKAKAWEDLLRARQIFAELG